MGVGEGCNTGVILITGVFYTVMEVNAAEQLGENETLLPSRMQSLSRGTRVQHGSPSWLTGTHCTFPSQVNRNWNPNKFIQTHKLDFFSFDLIS